MVEQQCPSFERSNCSYSIQWELEMKEYLQKNCSECVWPNNEMLVYYLLTHLFMIYLKALVHVI
jgi:hypothetical protein